MRNNTIKIKIRVMRSTKRGYASSCQLWTEVARGLANLWDNDKYV